MNQKFCIHGCGQIATHQCKNGNWVCNKTYQRCPEIIKKTKAKVGRKLSKKTIEKIRLKNTGKKRSLETRIKMSKSRKGRKVWNKGLKLSLEYVQKLIDSHQGQLPWNTGLTKETDIRLFKLSKKTIGKPKHTEEFKEKQRQRMINGGVMKCLKATKKISKQESKLVDIIKQLFPNCITQHIILNYSVDVALVENKIAIEYDGYFHFNSQEAIEYHNIRQNKIEKEGWKFLRYNIFQEFPSIDKIKEDINELINK